jgi:Spy/CpxP family protein refolding chaperone
MMKKFKQLAIVIAVTSIVSFPAFAHEDKSNECEEVGFRQHFKTDDDSIGDHRKHDSRSPGRAPFKLLDLTDAQKQILQDARTARKPAMREAHEKLRTAREALDKAGDQNADDATLNKLSQDLANIIAQQEVTRIKAHREFLNILTPEQKEKLTTFEAEHKGPAQWRDRQRKSSSNSAPKS